MKSLFNLLLISFILLPFVSGCIVVEEDGNGDVYYAPEIVDAVADCDPLDIHYWDFWAFVDDLDGYGDVSYVGIEVWYLDEFEEGFDLWYLSAGEWEWTGYAYYADCDFYYDYDYYVYAEDYIGNWDEIWF